MAIQEMSQRADSPHSSPEFVVDVLVIGAGLAGCYRLHTLRRAGFSVKVVEAGSDLGGIWHWNCYPGAGLPEVYEGWTWSEHYPGHEELQQYFGYMDEKLDLKKDVEFNRKVTSADWDEPGKTWKVRCNDGFSVQAKFLVAAIGFASKRYFPPRKGLDSFKGTIHHSSFWPKEGIDVRGKRVAVVGTGATRIQIAQECAREVGDEGSLTVFQRTPNLCCPMRQKKVTKEEDEKMKQELGEVFKTRLRFNTGFMYGSRKEIKGGFRFMANSYGDMVLSEEANMEAYKFWARKTRARIQDPRKRDILAPLKPPHPFGAKRLSLEQDFYEQFNRPYINVINVKANPIDDVVPEGIRTADGVVHEFDIIALATGFDSITGGLKDIDIKGSNGELLREKWDKGTWTYLGMTTSSFPNFFFLYGPQGPTAFSNGPSCVESQADWLLEVLQYMKEEGKEKRDATTEAEKEWKQLVHDFSARTLRHHTDSWYNGYNIPGKPRAPLNYAGGLPDYMRRLREVREKGMKGFEVS
ncbi:hypothetical protein BCR34DRAFT_621925 [Clohesyomyces aquaticus]|uniref:FAD/NAD(P)-binding domain-containing protein n=1 Tax=Clohesyomyces aquaticus TaxID=1231657 RepID=A0A1Y2A597_9PLEO|nr:hypothetical protein BCR34DRAFT_621925 [Clohesyomyces aquaticus]